jgi:hypothetical protein
LLLSFALQNYDLYQPYTIKTRRYIRFAKLYNTPLFILFLHTELSYGIYRFFHYKVIYRLRVEFRKQFYLPFWLFLKTLVIRKLGLYVSNLIYSFVWHTLSVLRQGLELHDPFSNAPFLKRIGDLGYHMTPIRILTFSFHKKVFNSFIIFLIALVGELNWSSHSTFKLVHSYIFFQHNHMLLFAFNDYYLTLYHV